MCSCAISYVHIWHVCACWLNTFKKLYPESNKQQYMVHYPLQISHVGPVIQSWNMRQLKLSFIKRVSRQSNYKNVCLTAAKKHRFWLCHQMLSSYPPLIRARSSKHVVWVKRKNIYRQQILPHLTDITVRHPDWVGLQSPQLRISHSGGSGGGRLRGLEPPLLALQL